MSTNYHKKTAKVVDFVFGCICLVVGVVVGAALVAKTSFDVSSVGLAFLMLASISRGVWLIAESFGKVAKIKIPSILTTPINVGSGDTSMWKNSDDVNNYLLDCEIFDRSTTATSHH